MKKDNRKKNKIKISIRRKLRREKKKNSVLHINDIKMPRKIRRNKVKELIKKDGAKKINKRMRYYWRDVQDGAYKI